MNQVSESSGRWAGPRRGLLGTVATLGMVAGSLAVAQPASAAPFTTMTATSTPVTTGAARALTIAWVPDDTGGVLSYRAEADGPDVGTTPDASCAVNVGTNTCPITGLLAGTPYTVTVTARDTNVAGGGGAVLGIPAATVVVAPGASTTPALPKPSAPTTAATGVSGEVEVTLGTEPVIAADVVNYTATAYLGGVATAHSCTTADAVTRSCKISGLTDGTEYTFRVMANAVGTNPDSALSDANVSTAATPSIKPSAPTNVVANAYYNAVKYDATVSWTAPTTAGVTIASYTVVTHQADGTPIGGTTCTPSPATATVCNTTGTDLDPNVPYYFTVTATSTAGQTSLAGQSPIIIPTAAPGVPQNATAVGGDGQAVVTWQAPAAATPVVASYRVRAVTGGVATAFTCTTTGLTCTVTGLTNGTAYTFSVKAVGSTGSGTESAAATSNSVTPAEVAKPVTPTGVTATPTDTTIDVAWATPAANPTVPVLFYTATASPGGKACATVSGAVYGCTITGLTPETDYTVTVVAKGANSNSADATATTKTTAAVTPPGDGGDGPGDVTGPIVVNKDGKAQMFARGGGSTAKLWTAVKNATTGDWEDWTDLGGPIYSDPVAVKNTNGTLQVFVLDASGYVTYKVQSNTGAFGAWTRISMTKSLANIEVATNADGKVQVFGRSGDHLVYSVQTTGADAWSSWIDLGWPISGAPSVVEMSDGRLEVFVSGYQGAIYRRAQKVVNVNTSEADWTAWERLAPATSGAEFM